MGQAAAGTIAERVAAVRARIAAAAVAAGREPAEIRLVAAAKTRTAGEVAEVIAAGVGEIGHNYVQELAAMRPAVVPAATWRLIGPLQKNKINAALRCCETIDSLHSAELAVALESRAARAERVVEVLVQVQLGGEATKSGVTPADLEQLLEVMQPMPHLRCLGLMTIPPPGAVGEARRWFAELRSIADRLRAAAGLALPYLSMGMSHDFEAAIGEGATHLRLGTALFGPRGG